MITATEKAKPKKRKRSTAVPASPVDPMVEMKQRMGELENNLEAAVRALVQAIKGLREKPPEDPGKELLAMKRNVRLSLLMALMACALGALAVGVTFAMLLGG